MLQIQIYVSVLQNGWVTLGQLSIRASKRGVYQFLQIQISVSVLQNGWMTLGQLSIEASTRGVYQLLQIQIYVSVLQNGRVTLGPIRIKAYLLLREVCINCLDSKYMIVFYKMDRLTY